MSLLNVFKGKWIKAASVEWTLIAVGSPSLSRLETRGNLGRLMLMRWGMNQEGTGLAASRMKTGTLYHPVHGIRLFIPEISERRLWEASMELGELGSPPVRQIFVATDLRLTLGFGRLRLSGAVDHPSLKTAAGILGKERVARFVFGIGPMDQPRDAFRAGRWTEGEWERLAALDTAFGRFMALLQDSRNLPDLALTVNPIDFWTGPRQP